MTDRDPHIAMLLDEAAPAARPTADRWDAVLREAAVGRGRRRGAAASALAAAAAVLVLVLAWPFGGGGGGVLDRALAALGDGPVLHVVRQGDWGGEFVDLRTGARTDVPGIDEDWWDAGRNLLRHVSRLGGTVLADSTSTPARPPQDVVALATRYRAALESGSARVAGEGEVDGKPVDWITVHSESLPDVADGKLHEWAQQVAISRESYEPVATRETRDGVEGPGTFERIVAMENVSEGEAAFGDPKTGQVIGPVAFSPGLGTELPLASAGALVPGLLWAGHSFDGRPLSHVGKLEYKSGYDRVRRTWAHELDGVLLAYGDSVSIRETKGLPLLPLRDATPPPGSAYVSHGRAVLERGGVHVEIEAPDDATALAAARALEPLSAGSGARP